MFSQNTGHVFVKAYVLKVPMKCSAPVISKITLLVSPVMYFHLFPCECINYATPTSPERNDFLSEPR